MNGRQAGRESGWVPREKRFWSQVDKTGDCWIWTGRVLHGYGRLGHQRVHRLAYTWLVGPIPEEMTLDHLCGRKLCVNPAHLEVCTHGENVRRHWAEWRERRGY